MLLSLFIIRAQKTNPNRFQLFYLTTSRKFCGRLAWVKYCLFVPAVIFNWRENHPWCCHPFMAHLFDTRSFASSARKRVRPDRTKRRSASYSDCRSFSCQVRGIRVHLPCRTNNRAFFRSKFRRTPLSEWHIAGGRLEHDQESSKIVVHYNGIRNSRGIKTKKKI